MLTLFQYSYTLFLIVHVHVIVLVFIVCLISPQLMISASVFLIVLARCVTLTLHHDS